MTGRGLRRLVVAASLATSPALAEPGTLEVTVTGVRNANGHVLVAICKQDEFTHETCALRGRALAKVGAVVVRISGVPPGIYAAQAFHDENDNNKVDRNFLGMPQEGLGFSNDAPMRFGPPAFNVAAFRVGAAGGSIQFALRYF